MLAIRATLAFLLLPAVVAGVVPFLFIRGTPVADQTRIPGGLLLVVGLGLLLACVRDFFVAGRGTLAPWDPPQRLVVVGLYRVVRNPMYLAVLTTVAGWMLLFSSWPLALYLLGLAAAFHLRVVLGEEPWLRRQFGAEWENYERDTGRWLPKLKRRRTR